MELPEHYPNILGELAELICECLCTQGIADQAESLALTITEGIRENFQGSLIYIPMGDRFLRHRRNAAILREFTGNNYRELAHRYRLNLATVYNIIANNCQN